MGSIPVEGTMRNVNGLIIGLLAFKFIALAQLVKKALKKTAVSGVLRCILTIPLGI